MHNKHSAVMHTTLEPVLILLHKASMGHTLQDLARIPAQH